MDTKFQILLAVIEAVTEQPLVEAFDTLLFNPLNLRQTFHPGTEPSQPMAPVAAVWTENTPVSDKPLAMASFGDLNSTVDDLIAFMRALLDGKVFAKQETWDLMRGQWNTFGFGFSPRAPGWPIQYGLGMMRFRMPRGFTPFHPMPEVIGHTGPVGSWLFYCPPLDLILTGTVSQVTAAAAPFRILPRMLRLLERIRG